MAAWSSGIRVDRFFLVQHIKTEKNILNDHEIYHMYVHMAIEYTRLHIDFTTFSIPRPSKIYRNWDFFGVKIYHLATLSGIVSACHRDWSYGS
jgi:hypothetical protein